MPLSAGPRRGIFRFDTRRPSATRRRPQRVRFRRRYAVSRAAKWGKATLFLAKATGVVVGAYVGLIAAQNFWHDSPSLQIKEVVMNEACPPGLKGFLGIQERKNIFDLRPSFLQKRAREKFPEIDDISIVRYFDRSVHVEVELREPIAVAGGEAGLKGVDPTGKVFPLSGAQTGATLPVLISNASKQTERAAKTLAVLRQKLPAFYGLIKEVKTDTILPTQISLTNGVAVSWNEFGEEMAIVGGQQILRILEMYQPAKEKAMLRFIGDGRVVMNANWKKIDG